jgi:hypothetical protein
MKEKMQAKRILAIVAIVLLVGMYITSLVLAIIHSPAALNFLKISLGATLIVPIILYFIMMFLKLSTPNLDPEEKVYADEKDDPFTEEDFED